MPLEIVQNDILKIGSLMGKDFLDPERTAILRTMDSCNIQACPGSGKTTAMVAKLAILAEKLQGTNQGICALSHTNAARKEIETSLGRINYPLLGYPHFIGTIQVFIDTFLTLPGYQKRHGHRPLIIDDESYEYAAARSYQSLNSGTRYFLEQNRSRGSREQRLRVQYAKEYFSKLNYRFENIDEFIYFENNTEQDFLAGSASASYQDALSAKRIITQDGYLTYHDAFAFGNWYISEYAHLAQVLALRFPFVFIDEMQDTDRYQLALIEKIFSGHSIIQKFGDANQAIYNHQNDETEQVWNPPADFQITTSKRLSPTIAKLSRTLGVSPQNIQGNPERPEHNHTIIRFAFNQAEHVIPAFAELLRQEHLANGTFMALGAVAKPNPQHLTIQNYWPTFLRRSNRQITASNFWEYVDLAHNSIAQDGSISGAKNHLLNAISKILRDQNSRTTDNRPFTASIIESEINKKGAQQSYILSNMLLKWIKDLAQNIVISSDQIISDLQLLLSLIDLQLNPQTISNIHQDRNQNRVNNQPVLQLSNLYHHSETINIGINTIHSAKGQTHQATLLLETFYNQYDLQQIKSYLWGIPVRRPGLRIQQRFLPLTYVACTRPTHLLCLAILGDHLSDATEVTQLINYGWQIIDL